MVSCSRSFGSLRGAEVDNGLAILKQGLIERRARRVVDIVKVYYLKKDSVIAQNLRVRIDVNEMINVEWLTIHD